ncbi:MAG: TlpA disulfide reductase family protein [Bacteroidota bacterium]|nr:TlpA disulfide reductase family protein [Bacteroidota bacterium]
MKQLGFIAAVCVLAAFCAVGARAQDGSSIAGDRVTAGDAAHPVAAPPFVVASLDEEGTYFANESFTGRIVLVDFWATWCPPCVEALPEMEQIYEEYHTHGFDILSLSFDASDERIRRFREKRYPMPWKHARLVGAFNDVVSLSFGLQNIPHYVLIGREGSVLAAGDDVHGERLRELLTKHLGK